jgi:hypothetical protein
MQHMRVTPHLAKCGSTRNIHTGTSILNNFQPYLGSAGREDASAVGVVQLQLTSSPGISMPLQYAFMCWMPLPADSGAM